MNKKFLYTYAVLRIGVGWVFLWAFIDKTFGLNFSTSPENAWLEGVSPTTGFLIHGTKGPFVDFYQSLAGNPMVDILFMTGLLFLGVSLMLGISLRLAGFFGFIFMILMYTAGSIWPTQNPFMDYHLIYAFLLLSFAFMPKGYPLGFGRSWSRRRLVEKYKILK